MKDEIAQFLSDVQLGKYNLEGMNLEEQNNWKAQQILDLITLELAKKDKEIEEMEAEAEKWLNYSKELVQRANNREEQFKAEKKEMIAMIDKYHWEIQSPFTPGEKWYAGLTPHGVTGWNGRPDYQGVGDTMEEAVADAIKRVETNQPTL